MTFQYFRYPHQFSSYINEAKSCEICGELRFGYEGPFYGETDIEFLCEQCLLEGKLAEIEGFSNEGNPKAVRQQLAQVHPELGEAQIADFVQQCTSTLEHCTPHPQTWQELTWPIYCADYCQFIKEVGKTDLNTLTSEGNGKLFFSEHLDEKDRPYTNVDEIWKTIRPDLPEDNSVAYTVGVYLFQCLHCQEYIILWDSD